MRASVDSEIYISGAEKLVQGEFPSGKDVLYASYILVLALLHLLNLGGESILYLHFFAAILAIICTYQLALRSMNNHNLAVIAPLLYVLWFKFQQWNMIIYTDALFSHMVVISVFAFTTATNVKQKAMAFALILFTGFIRPTGVGLLFAVGVCVVVQLSRTHRFQLYQKNIISFTIASLSLFFLNTVLAHFIDSFIKSYENAEINTRTYKCLLRGQQR